MADGKKNVEKLSEILECSICFKPFADPRMLPCIHTFCFECLKRTSDSAKKNSGEMLPCPLCRKEFSIPEEGISGLQKNFFMDNLIEVKKMVHMSKTSNVCCDICSEVNQDGNGKDIPEATQRCLECQQNLCDSCSTVHNILKISRIHTVVKIRDTSEEELIKRFPTTNCVVHKEKPLDYYCNQCKKVVCVSCFVESHSSHGCKAVITMETEFREIIEKNTPKLSDCVQKMHYTIQLVEQRKADFLSNISEVENLILKRTKKLKEMIKREKKSLLKELSSIKGEYLRELHLAIEEMERRCVVSQKMEIYCSELISKGSATDICSCVDEILKRFDEIDKETADCRWPKETPEVSFSTTDTIQNLVGQIQTEDKCTTCAVLIGIDDGLIITKDVIRVNLHGNEISYMSPIPTSEIPFESSAAVYRNSIYVVGTGKKCNEIWKHDWRSGWIKRAYLVEGRRRHSVAFVDEVLYICGGISPSSDDKVLDSVEGYNDHTNICRTVGKLVCGVQNASNCVSFKNSLYIFGGSDENGEDLDLMQKYDTNLNTCTLLSKPMPRPYRLMRAALWHTSVILLGDDTCFIFNLEMESWEEREQFKTEVDHFAMVLEDSRIFVIGGGRSSSDDNNKDSWKCRDDVRYVPVMDIFQNKSPEWKVLARLPKPSLVYSYAKTKQNLSLVQKCNS